MKLGIFTSFSGQHLDYIKACTKYNIEYEIIDILSSRWIENIINANVDGFLCSSTCDFQERKTILDERYYFTSHILSKKIYPSYLSLFLHENKRNMATWLKINNIPHVPTHVFLNKNDAYKFVENVEFPIVSKANIGAGASKVIILKSKSQSIKLINRIFPKISLLPFLNLGKIYSRKVKYNISIPDLASTQKNFVLFQDFMKIKHEWRIIKIGNSYFGHQKLLKGNYASGSGLVGWVKPPVELLNMVRNICKLGGFSSMDVDIFETENGSYYVNELQTLFGSYCNYQMKINNIPGRYIYENGKFIFEEGEFNTNSSMDLRVLDFVAQLKKNYYETI